MLACSQKILTPDELEAESSLPLDFEPFQFVSSLEVSPKGDCNGQGAKQLIAVLDTRKYFGELWTRMLRCQRGRTLEEVYALFYGPLKFIAR